MAEFKKYVDIERVKPAYSDVFTIGELVTITEKVDGSNGSFAYDPTSDTVYAYSRRQKLSPEKNLGGFYELVMSIPKNVVKTVTENGRYVIFGEWLVRNKINYRNYSSLKFYLFDVWDTVEEHYMPYGKILEVANELNFVKDIELAPLFYYGAFKGWDHVHSFVGQTKLGAEPCGEGVVVKSQERFGDIKNSRRPTHLKLVSEHFAEVQKTKAPVDPEVLKAREAQRELAATIVTKRRIEKLLMKMAEDGIIPYEWNEHDMGTIAKNINKLSYQDCVKEESEIVAQIENFGKVCGSLTMEIVREILKEKETL